MKKLIFILVIFSTLAFTKVMVNNTSVVILPKSELLIKGKTNVNSFKCDFNLKQIENPIPLYYQIKDNKLVFDQAKLVLDNQCFDCGSKAINKDFNKLLKTETYPEIKLHLKEINKTNKKENTVTAKVEIFIAGKTQSYTLPVTIKDKQALCVYGKLKLNITDFGLEAPKKALGLIVVSNEIEINFNLSFAQK